MNAPSNQLLRNLAKAMRKCPKEHKNVCEHLVAATLWALYPEWFNREFDKSATRTLRKFESEEQQ